MPATRVALKRALMGRQRASRELRRQLLPKWLALPVFAADPLSSVVYATEVLFVALAAAGALTAGALAPVILAVVALLGVVVTSYRRLIRLYPQGGGAFAATRESLGVPAGLLAAGALLVGFALTVAVAMAALAATLASLTPSLHRHRVLVALVVLAMIAVVNVRGTRETSPLFSLPTYAFVLAMLVVLAVGSVRCIGGCPSAAPGTAAALEPALGLGGVLVLRALASGAAALTGIEAFSNGVAAFRFPQSRNAAATLGAVSVLGAGLLAGLGLLAHAVGAAPTSGGRTVLAQTAAAVVGEGAGLVLVQLATAGILVLAANRAYADVRRLCARLAAERFLPGHLTALGDRLAFSNVVLALTAAAAVLLLAVRAGLVTLVLLSVVSVFTAFVLSHTALARRWLTHRERGWWHRLLLEAVGAAGTALVLVIATAMSLTSGAWLVLAAIAATALGMGAVHRHYRDVGAALASGAARSTVHHPRPHHAVIVIERVDEAAARAVSYARGSGALSIEAIAAAPPESDVVRRWAELAPEIPLQVLPGRGGLPALPQLCAVLDQTAARHPADFTTAIVAEQLSHTWTDQVLHHRLPLRLKDALLAGGELVVADLNAPAAGPGPYTVEEPVEHHVVVLVAGVHQATLRALAYAESLEATSLRGLFVNLNAQHAGPMLEAWRDWGIQVPLELVDSPLRSLTHSIRDYIAELRPDGRHTVVTCVLPESVLPHRRERWLHNQTAVLIRSGLLFDRGVVTVSVPFRVEAGAPPRRAAASA